MIAFQFTTSQGGRQARQLRTLSLQPFNSRPHKEVDDLTGRTEQMERLSIHDLTRRSTVFYQLFAFFYRLSIHDLTRRSTRGCKSRSQEKSSFNSRPHKEVDYGDLSDVSDVETFNSRPHKEVDYSDMAFPKPVRNFQFTTSQGGRPGLE